MNLLREEPGEIVVLVDEQDRVLGSIRKEEAHGPVTPLHRGFSCFVFRAKDKQLLLQQRSGTKVTWPLVWSNSCCGHPAPGESSVQAARRRLAFELDVTPTLLEEVAPYRYCFTRDGVMENEICPVLLAIVEHEPTLNPDEVAAVRWIEWSTFMDEIEQGSAVYSEWCVEEARILERTSRFAEVLGM